MNRRLYHEKISSKRTMKRNQEERLRLFEKLLSMLGVLIMKLILKFR